MAAAKGLVGWIWILACIGMAGVASAQSIAGEWSDEFHVNGTERPARAIATVDGKLVVGGSFTTAGPAIAENLAWYDAGGWHGFTSSIATQVHDLILADGVLHALTSTGGGSEPGAVEIWTLGGTDWSLAASFISPHAHDCGVAYAGDVFVGGWRWDGVDLEQVITFDGPVRGQAVVDDLMLLGGNFEVVNGDTLGHLVAWDGEDVSSPWPVLDTGVWGVAVLDGQPWVGTGSGNSTVLRRWTDDGWSTEIWISAGSWPFGWLNDRRVFVVDGTLYFAYDGSDLYSGLRRLWRWDPDSEAMVIVADVPVRDAVAWEDGFAAVHAVAQDPTLNLHTVSYFPPAAIGGDPRMLGEPGLGFSATVRNLDTTSGLTIGGSFDFGGGQRSCSIVRYHEGQWSGWGPANDAYIGSVSSVCHVDHLLIASTTIPAGCISERGVYEWYGDQWSFVMEPDLQRLTVIPGPWIYGFSEEGNIHRLPGGDVIGVASGGGFRDLAVWNGELIAGGGFASVGGATQGVLATYSGGSWHDLADPLVGSVWALGTWQEQLVVAGNLEFPDQAGYQVAVWSDGAWQTLPGIFDRAIYDVCGYGDMVVVGGSFTHVGDLPIAGIAAWRDGQWHALGEGCNNLVYALAVLDDRLWIGGGFTVAGGKAASRLTWWRPGTTVHAPEASVTAMELSVYPNPGNPAVTIAYVLPVAAHVVLDVFDLAGRCVAHLANGSLPAGQRQTVWDGMDLGGRPVASGVYLVRLQTPTSQASQRLVLIR